MSQIASRDSILLLSKPSYPDLFFNKFIDLRVSHLESISRQSLEASVQEKSRTDIPLLFYLLVYFDEIAQ